MKKYIVLCIIHGKEMSLHFSSKKDMFGYLENNSGISVLKIEVWKYVGFLPKSILKKRSKIKNGKN